jgi:hypothetical protein
MLTCPICSAETFDPGENICPCGFQIPRSATLDSPDTRAVIDLMKRIGKLSDHTGTYVFPDRASAEEFWQDCLKDRPHLEHRIDPWFGTDAALTIIVRNHEERLEIAERYKAVLHTSIACPHCASGQFCPKCGRCEHCRLMLDPNTAADSPIYRQIAAFWSRYPDDTLHIGLHMPNKSQGVHMFTALRGQGHGAYIELVDLHDRVIILGAPPDAKVASEMVVLFQRKGAEGAADVIAN